MDAFCPRHADQPAIGSCTRCGGFVCALDRRLVRAQSYCPDCATRDDVDWLGAYRRSLWGKRDGWGWFYGLAAVGHLGTAVTAGIASAWPLVAHASLAAGCALAFFLGKPWARKALLSVHLLALAGGVALSDLGLGLAGGFATLVLVSALSDLRCKLFFKLEVSDERLLKYWNTYANNPAARHAVNLGALGLFIPFLGLAALALGAVALSRVDAQAAPPVGRRGLAVLGVVLGLCGVGLHTAMVLSAWR